MKEQLKQEIGRVAEHLASETVAVCKADSGDAARQNEALYDLRLGTVREAAELAGATVDDELLYELAQVLPAYDISSLYQTRASFISLTSSVLAGWVLGGLLATVLGIFRLGGDILRPCAILACLWCAEYFSVNPRARKIGLAALGLGGLARLAAGLASGIVRIASLGSLRQFIFGSLPRPNIFKCLWLWVGAIFLCIFFARRETSVNFAALQQSLEKQVGERLDFCILTLREFEKLRSQLENARPEILRDSVRCPKQNCELAEAALSLLDVLDGDKSAWLAGILARLGYEPQSGGRLTWSSAIHADMYDPIGLIGDGDEFLVLKRPYVANGKLIRGQAQRIAGEAKA